MAEVFGPIDYARLAEKLREELVAKDFEQELSDESIAADSYTDVDISTDGLYSGILLACRAAYNAAATAGVRVLILYSLDGTNFDSEEDAEAEGNKFEPTFSAGETRQRSVIFSLISSHARVRVRNLDTVQSVTVSLWRGLCK